MNDATRLALQLPEPHVAQANFAARLASLLMARDTDAFAAELRDAHFEGCELSVRFDPELSEHFLIGLAKTSPAACALAFSPKAIAEGNLELLLLVFSWILPLLAAFVRSPRGIEGAAVFNQWDVGVAPGLAYSAAGDGFFLIPDNLFVSTRGYADFRASLAGGGLDWSARKPIAFWRGSTTGQAQHWRDLPRVQLCRLALAHPDICDVGLTSFPQVTDDAASEMASEGLTKPFVPATEMHRYKYLIDIDGNSNAWTGLFQRLMSGGAVLKVMSPHGYRQWWYDRLKPWTHFAPVSSDMSDLVDKIRWLIAHDDQAERIARQGRELAMSLDYEAEVANGVETINAAFRAASARRPLRDLIAGALTAHDGAIVVYRQSDGLLMHFDKAWVAADASLRPVRLETSADGVRLALADNSRIATLGAEGRATLSSSGEPFELAPLGGSGFALSRGGRFVCADHDRRVTLSRDSVSLWETFRVAAN